MLKSLHLRDYAIVDAVDVELDGRMSVFTGETGAGKSILVEALGLALGERADAACVRAGAERASISAVFDLTAAPGVRRLLVEQGLAEEAESGSAECILRRQIARDGRSRAFVNDAPVAAQTLRALGEQLVDIYGQNTHQSLVRRDVQRALLDDFGSHATELAAVREAHGRWRAAAQRLEALAPAEDAEQQQDYLRHQLAELQGVALAPEALEALEQEHRRLAHAAELLEGARGVLELLETDEGPQSTLGAAARRLTELTRFEPRLGGPAELLEAAAVNAEEAALDLTRVLDGLDIDPARLEELERQLAALHAAARKHRCAPRELTARRDELAARLEALGHAAQDVEALQRELETARAGFETAAGALGARRAAAAPRMAEAISALLGELGMPHARFEVALEADEGPPAAHGRERVGFLIATNPGQPLLPLARVASGGEVARISLAIQVAAASDRSVATLVFDEVDVGVGGRVAEMVGRNLRALGERRQVLCVTHLPQVATQAHAHLQVQKLTDGRTTRTQLHTLEGETRVAEVARMLGGVDLTPETLDHARAMLAAAQGRPRRRSA